MIVVVTSKDHGCRSDVGGGGDGFCIVIRGDWGWDVSSVWWWWVLLW